MAIKNKSSDEIKKVSEEIDSENFRKFNSDSPVVDEDGVVRDVPLLAGYFDSKTGELYSTFSYREMNGRDEEAISRNDVTSNGGKLANIVCERCVVAIGSLTKKSVGAPQWAKIIRSMLGGDLDYMMLKIREISKGTSVEFTHTCPRCGSKIVTEVETSEFKIIPFNGLREVPFELIRGFKDPFGNVHKTGTLRIPTGEDREYVFPFIRKNPSTATTVLLTRLITFDDGKKLTQNQVADLSLRDRQVLEDTLRENSFGVDSKISDIVCSNCGANLSGEIGTSNFF